MTACTGLNFPSTSIHIHVRVESTFRVLPFLEPQGAGTHRGSTPPSSSISQCDVERPGLGAALWFPMRGESRRGEKCGLGVGDEGKGRRWERNRKRKRKERG